MSSRIQRSPVLIGPPLVVSEAEKAAAKDRSSPEQPLCAVCHDTFKEEETIEFSKRGGSIIHTKCKPTTWMHGWVGVLCPRRDGEWSPLQVQRLQIAKGDPLSFGCMVCHKLCSPSLLNTVWILPGCGHVVCVRCIVGHAQCNVQTAPNLAPHLYCHTTISSNERTLINKAMGTWALEQVRTKKNKTITEQELANVIYAYLFRKDELVALLGEPETWIFAHNFKIEGVSNFHSLPPDVQTSLSIKGVHRWRGTDLI